ncbi:unnamed protein product [Ectocarpus sp. 8 AP-2014]
MEWTLPSSCGFLPHAAAGGKNIQSHPNFGRSSNPSGKREEAGWRSGRKSTRNVVPSGCSARQAAPAAARDIVQAVKVYR